MNRFVTALLLAISLVLAGPILTGVASVPAVESQGGSHDHGGTQIHHCADAISCGSSMALQNPDAFPRFSRPQAQAWSFCDDRTVYSALAKGDPPVPRRTA